MSFGGISGGFDQFSALASPIYAIFQSLVMELKMKKTLK